MSQSRRAKNAQHLPRATKKQWWDEKPLMRKHKRSGRRAARVDCKRMVKEGV